MSRHLLAPSDSRSVGPSGAQLCDSAAAGGGSQRAESSQLTEAALGTFRARRTTPGLKLPRSLPCPAPAPAPSLPLSKLLVQKSRDSQEAEKTAPSRGAWQRAGPQLRLRAGGEDGPA